jgi:hypothetical protein
MIGNDSRTTKVPFPLKTENLAGTSDILSKPSFCRSTSNGKSPFTQFVEGLSPLDSVKPPHDDGIPPTVDHTISDEATTSDQLRRVQVAMDSTTKACKESQQTQNCSKLAPLKTDNLVGLAIGSKPSLRRSTSNGKSPFTRFVEGLSPSDLCGDTPREEGASPEPRPFSHMAPPLKPKSDPGQTRGTKRPRESPREPSPELIEAQMIISIVQEQEIKLAREDSNAGRQSKEAGEWGSSSPIPTDLDLDQESSWDSLENSLPPRFSSNSSTSSLSDHSLSDPETETQYYDEPPASQGTKKGKQACSCAKSRCLKLYCECFAGGLFCVGLCACVSCANTNNVCDKEERGAAVKRLLKKKGKSAFRKTSLERKVVLPFVQH